MFPGTSPTSQAFKGGKTAVLRLRNLHQLLHAAQFHLGVAVLDAAQTAALHLASAAKDVAMEVT